MKDIMGQEDEKHVNMVSSNFSEGYDSCSNLEYLECSDHVCLMQK